MTPKQYEDIFPLNKKLAVRLSRLNKSISKGLDKLFKYCTEEEGSIIENYLIFNIREKQKYARFRDIIEYRNWHKKLKPIIENYKIELDKREIYSYYLSKDLDDFVETLDHLITYYSEKGN